MQKIVINRCFGGFGLSVAAMKQLIARNADGVEVYTVDEYTNGKGFRSVLYRLMEVGNGYSTISDLGKDVLIKDGMVYRWSDRNRSDPNLAAVAEELGSEASSGCYAKLKIVEVPEDVEWSIEEYDGLEHIAERHRTWGVD